MYILLYFQTILRILAEMFRSQCSTKKYLGADAPLQLLQFLTKTIQNGYNITSTNLHLTNKLHNFPLNRIIVNNYQLIIAVQHLKTCCCSVQQLVQLLQLNFYLDYTGAKILPIYAHILNNKLRPSFCNSSNNGETTYEYIYLVGSLVMASFI